MAFDATFWAFWLSPAMLFIVGACLGSFLNLVALRLPVIAERRRLLEAAEVLADVSAMERVAGVDEGTATRLAHASSALAKAITARPAPNLTTDASRCPSCGHRLRWHENLPVIGWLRLRGRCGACSAPIAVRYFLVELLTAAVFALLAWGLGPHPSTLLWCGFTAFAITLGLMCTPKPD